METDRQKWASSYIGILMCLVAIVYLSKKVFFESSDTADFKFIWLAGHLWDSGIDAYTDAFARTGQAMFVGTNRPEGLLYPPSWYPIASAVAKLPYDTAAWVWRAASGLMLVAGGLICIGSVRQNLGNAGWLRIGFFALFIGASSSSAITLNLGQTSPIIFLGVTLFLHAIFSKSTFAMVIALSLVMLKPNFGIVLVAVLLAQPFWWRAVLGAIVLSFLASLPVFWLFGPLNTLSHYLEQLSQYDGLATNLPPSATGLRNLVFHLTGYTLPSTGMALLGAVGAFFIGRSAGIRSEKQTNRVVATAAEFSLVLSLAFLAVSLHTYDLFILGPLILATIRYAWLVQIFVIGSMLVILRGTNFALVTGLYFQSAGYFPDSFLASLAILVLFAIAFVNWLRLAQVFTPSVK